MLASCCEKRPAGFFAVPLNIKCSRKCAIPDLPGGSSAAPTRYHSMWVTTGVRRSGITTTLSPFASLNCVTWGAATVSREGSASAAQTAKAAKIRINTGTAALEMPVPGTADRSWRGKTVKHNLMSLFVSDRPVENGRDFPSAAPVSAEAIRLRGRWRLVAGRRLGERPAGRLAGELSLLIQVFAHQRAPAEDAERPLEFARVHRTADIGFLNRALRLRRIGDAAGARIGAAAQFIRRHHGFGAGFVRIGSYVRLGTNHHFAVRLARPRRIARRDIGGLRRRQVAGRRNDQRRALAIIDSGAADIDAHAAEDVLDDLLLECVLVVLRGRGGGRKSQQGTAHADQQGLAQAR